MLRYTEQFKIAVRKTFPDNRDIQRAVESVRLPETDEYLDFLFKKDSRDLSEKFIEAGENRKFQKMMELGQEMKTRKLFVKVDWKFYRKENPIPVRG